MRLATLAEYRRLVYAEGSAPTLNTLRRRINDIPGGRIELGRYFVDMDENDRQRGIKNPTAKRIAELRASPLLKNLL
jgi:hypothetical protein